MTIILWFLGGIAGGILSAFVLIILGVVGVVMLHYVNVVFEKLINWVYNLMKERKNDLK